MSLNCEYHKYGCNVKLANQDHAALHVQAHAGAHLALVVPQLEKQVEINHTLTDKLKKMEEVMERMDKMEGKLQSLLEKKEKDGSGFLSSHRSGFALPIDSIKKDENLSAGAQSPRKMEEKLSPRKVEFAPQAADKKEVKVPTWKKDSNEPKKEEEKVPTWKKETLARQEALEKEKREKEAAAEKDRVEKVVAIAGLPPLSPVVVRNAAIDREPAERPHTSMNLRDEYSPRLGSRHSIQVPMVEKRGVEPGSPSLSAHTTNDIPTKKPEHVSANVAAAAKIRSKTWSTTPSKGKDQPSGPVGLTLLATDGPGEEGIIWEYDSEADEWVRGKVFFKMTKAPFSEGSLRVAHMLELMGEVKAVETTPPHEIAQGKNIEKHGLPQGLTAMGNRFVAKISKTKVPAERYFEDVKMQMICVEQGKKFNVTGVPKKVDFLYAWVMEVPKDGLWYGLEHYIEGEFKKQNSNFGAVLSDRNTPQAFSHFTYERSKHSMLVVDLQGVNDYYTDPQIHTKDGKGFGLGNLGKNGIDRFLKTHQCNAVCQLIGLPRINPLDSRGSSLKLLKGTQQVPFIEDQLQAAPTYPVLECADELENGEFQCVQTLAGHVDRVVSLHISTNKKLFSGCGDGTVRVWGLPGVTFEKELNVHRKSVECIVSNEKYFFTASADHCIKVWDLQNYSLVIALRDHTGEVNSLVLSDKVLNYAVSASFDKTIKVWNLRTFKCINTLTGHLKSVKTLAISGTILFSGSNDGSIYVWSLKHMSCIFAIDAHEGWVKTLAVKDKTLFSGSFDYQVKSWDLTSFQHVETYSDHNDNVSCLCATEKYLLSTSEDKTLMIRDYETEKVVAVLKGHRSGIQAVVTDGRVIFTGSDDCAIKVWKWVDKS